MDEELPAVLVEQRGDDEEEVEAAPVVDKVVPIERDELEHKLLPNLGHQPIRASVASVACAPDFLEVTTRGASMGLDRVRSKYS